MKNSYIFLLIMGLVLCSVLALWKSQNILDDFSKIAEKLEISSLNDDEKSEKVIQLLLEKAQKVDKNKALTDSLVFLHTQKQGLLYFIQNIDSLLRHLPGVSDPATGELLKKNETQANIRLLFGDDITMTFKYCENKSSLVYQLKEKINEFYLLTFQIHNQGKADSLKWKEAEKTLPEASDEICWETYNFDAPLIANLAMLESLKIAINEREWHILQEYAKRLHINLSPK